MRQNKSYMMVTDKKKTLQSKNYKFNKIILTWRKRHMYSSLCLCICVFMFGRSSSRTSVVQLCLLAPSEWLQCGPSLVCSGHKLEPLSQRIAECLWESVHISQDHVERKGKFLHVRPNFRKLTRSLKYGHFDIQYRVLGWRDDLKLRFKFIKQKNTYFWSHS